ncbi:AAA family ATPase [Pseudoalteromonas piscicida]|uniref:ATP-dependent nuclease n=1 Tax=Pseudoalteromonas piscicida TaxID=43662 RepID=UPI001EFCCBDB|nr:AAA family ATPase [Pseudoalteromonas piscicida]MCG9771464.1 AAA family ATPase [Pseudoalteromonas piscicida]
MEFPTNIQVNINVSSLSGVEAKEISVHSGITTLLGPNGSGKTQLLRALKQAISPHSSAKKVRYISAGRLGPLETYRSNYDGQRGSRIRFEDAQYGDKRSLNYRHENETVLGDFGTLSERPDILIKIQERLKKLFKRNIFIEWDGGHLRVNFTRVDSDTNNYSSSREASGLLHLTAILAAIYDDEVGAVLIDEPEVSLHPQLQSFLLQEIKKVAGNPEEDGKKLVVLSTHSTEFVELNSVDELASIVFCNDVFTAPIQIDPQLPEFRSRKIQALLSRIGQEHKLALFCHSPLLVEGPSDQIMCSSISRKMSLNTEAAGSQILPVTGKGQFPVVIKLMRLIGKNPVMMGDADALTDSLDIVSSFTSLPQANSIASEMGHRDAPTFSRNVYNDFSNLVDSNWSDIEPFASLHSYWVHRDLERDEIIAKRRAAFCWLMGAEQPQLNDVTNSQDWSSIKTRLLMLLGMLEKLGCFILRLGTIESYYQYSDQLTADEKPNAASHEATSILAMETSAIENSYGDIVRAIRYASSAEEINEAEAIREIVLAITTPALAMISPSTTEAELKSSSRNMFGAKSDLFNLSTKIENNEIYLVVELNTNILEVEGFPLEIRKGDNPIDEVNRRLNLT